MYLQINYNYLLEKDKIHEEFHTDQVLYFLVVQVVCLRYYYHCYCNIFLQTFQRMKDEIGIVLQYSYFEYLHF